MTHYKFATISVVLTISSVFLLTGCVSWSPGTTAGHPTAKIRFVDLNSKKLANTWVRFYKEENTLCDPDYKLQPVAVLNGIALDHGRVDLEMPLGQNFPKEAKTEVSVRADKALSFRMGWSIGNPALVLPTGVLMPSGSSCGVAASFEPKEDKLYEVSFMTDNGKCSVRVSELVQNSNSQYERFAESSAHQLELSGCNK